MSQPEQSESIFYHVPVELIDQLKKYRTKNSKFALRYRYRDPIEGVQYGIYGDVDRKEATTASIYLRNAETREKLEQVRDGYDLKLEEQKDINASLTSKVIQDGFMITELNERIGVMGTELETLAKRGDVYYRRWKRLRHWLPVRIACKLYWVLTGKEYTHDQD